MATQNPKIVISELGQEDLVREMTSEELADLEVLTQAAEERRQSEANELAQKKQARHALLIRLGLTEDEAKLLSL